MPGYSDPGFDTLALHAGASPDPATGARAVPIHLTTSFVFESSDHAASSWAGAGVAVLPRHDSNCPPSLPPGVGLASGACRRPYRGCPACWQASRM